MFNMKNISFPLILFLVSFLMAETKIDKVAQKHLQDFVAQAIVDEQFRQSEFGSNSPEGSVVAHVKPDSNMMKENPL